MEQFIKAQKFCNFSQLTQNTYLFFFLIWHLFDIIVCKALSVSLFLENSEILSNLVYFVSTKYIYY